MPAQVYVVGSCNLDLVSTVRALPAPGQTVLGSDVVLRAGGKGANQAVAAHRLGVPTLFVSATGDDEFAEVIRAALTAAGLDLAAVRTIAGASGVAFVMIDEASENMIAVASGANRRLDAAHVRTELAGAARGGVLLLQLEIPVDTAAAAAELANERGLTVVVNAAPVPADDASLNRLLAACDVLIVNEGEAQALAGGRDRDWPTLAADLLRRGPSTVVITLGGDGAVVADAEGARAVAAREVEVVDTTGAGDAFCGAFAAALALGRTAWAATELGCRAGALATTAVGAQAALPTMADLERA